VITNFRGWWRGFELIRAIIACLGVAFALLSFGRADVDSAVVAQWRDETVDLLVNASGVS
jgi:hypothetical protein